MDMVLAIQEALEEAAEPFALLDVMSYEEILDTIERNSHKITRLKWLTEQGEKHMRDKADQRAMAADSHFGRVIRLMAE